MSLPKAIFLPLFIVFIAATFIACDDAPAEDEEQEQSTEESSAVEESDDEAEDETSVELVDVSEEGDEFDPPVEKSQVPDGTWICDMGTVHYARGVKGDGKCPLCGMDLVAHGEGHADHDHHDHDHDHHDHDHDHH